MNSRKTFVWVPSQERNQSNRRNGSWNAAGSSPRQLDEAFELPDAGGVAHFAEGFGFDLADALAGRPGTGGRLLRGWESCFGSRSGLHSDRFSCMGGRDCGPLLLFRFNMVWALWRRADGALFSCPASCAPWRTHTLRRIPHAVCHWKFATSILSPAPVLRN